MLLKTEVDQRVETVDDLNPDIAAASAITTVRTTKFDEFFAPERHRACAAITGLDIDFCFIEKFHRTAVLSVCGHSRQSRCAKQKYRRFEYKRFFTRSKTIVREAPARDKAGLVQTGLVLIVSDAAG